MYQAMHMKLISDAAGLQDEELKAIAVIGEEDFPGGINLFFNNCSGSSESSEDIYKAIEFLMTFNDKSFDLALLFFGELYVGVVYQCYKLLLNFDELLSIHKMYNSFFSPFHGAAFRGQKFRIFLKKAIIDLKHHS